MEDTYSNMNMKTDIGGDMKVFKSLTSYVISMFSVMLIFAFISCANGTEDPGSNSDSKSGVDSGSQEQEETEKPQITGVSTSGSISEETVTIEEDSAKIMVDETSYYLFTETTIDTNKNVNARLAAVKADKGGTWAFYKNNKPLYLGTYKGSISEISKVLGASDFENSSGLKLELTVTRAADETGNLVEVATEAEEATFTFEINSSEGDSALVFEAAIPAVVIEVPAPGVIVDLTAVSAEEGIVLTFTVPESTSVIEIKKIEESGYEHTIWTDTDARTETISVTDYFVKKDKNYSYYVRFMDQSWALKHKTNIVMAKALKTSLEAPTIANKPSATYNASTGAFNFFVRPKSTITESNIEGYGNAVCMITYTNYFDVWSEENGNDKVPDWIQESCAGKTYGFLRFLIKFRNTSRSSQSYEFEVKGDYSFPDITFGINQPQPANSTPEGTIEMTATPAEEGIVLSFAVPEGTSVIEVKKIEENGYEHTLWTDTDARTETISLTDYFVKKDESYSYFVKFLDKGWQQLCSTYKVSAKALKTSLEAPSIANNPAATYNAATGAFEFSVRPESTIKESNIEGYGDAICMITYTNYLDVWSEENGNDKIPDWVQESSAGKTYSFLRFLIKFRNTVRTSQSYEFEVKGDYSFPDITFGI